jgi:hypothetical protein
LSCTFDDPSSPSDAFNETLKDNPYKPLRTQPNQNQTNQRTQNSSIPVLIFFRLPNISPASKFSLDSPNVFNNFIWEGMFLQWGFEQLA